MNILVVPPVTKEHKRLLLDACPDGSFDFITKDRLKEEDVRRAEVIIGNVPHAWLKGSDSLKLLQLGSAGADGYPEAMPEGARLTNSSGAYGLAIAEYMLAQLFAIIKKHYAYYDNQHGSLWRDEGQVTSVYGSTVLSVGMGDIGGEFLKRCRALGAHTIGVCRTAHERPEFCCELYTKEALDELLPRADVVALSLPGSEQTRGIIDARRLAMMKPGAVLINVGRGSAIVTEDLIEAASAGRVRAALDVTDPEPLPAEHPLWQTPNVYITPHISGFFHLPETLNRIIRISAENLRRYANCEPLLNLVDSRSGYRREEDRAAGFYE